MKQSRQTSKGVPKEFLTKEWRQFKPKMESPLFHMHTIVNDLYVVHTLVDNGAQAYASIRKDVAQRAKLELLNIIPREAEGWLKGPLTTIDQVAQLDIDVGGLGKRRAFAYVVAEQTEDLILGRPWLKAEGATIDEKNDCISLDWTDTKIYSNTSKTRRTTTNYLKIN